MISAIDNHGNIWFNVGPHIDFPNTNVMNGDFIGYNEVGKIIHINFITIKENILLTFE